MMRFLMVLALVFMAAHADAATTIRYYEDPVYKPLAPEDPHPMEDLIKLAEQGDARAQFILGDLYSKGKGGLGKNLVKARYWFETSARNGYSISFIRLAALAKRGKDAVSAYKWYTLSIDKGSSRERKWSQKMRERLIAERDMDKNDIRAGREAVNEWLRKREEVMAEERERARLAREEAEKNEDTVKITGKAAKSTARQPKKEHNYNE